MRDKDRSKAQLIKELVQLRQRVAQLEAAQAERGEAEQAITTSEEKYRGLFENAAAGIGISNAEGRVLALNKAMTQITGYTLEQFSKVDMGDTYVDPEARNEFLEIMQRDGVVENFEVQLIHKSGQPYWVSISTRPISYEEQDAYLTTALDINERVRMEEALHESRTKIRDFAEQCAGGHLGSRSGWQRWLYKSKAR